MRVLVVGASGAIGTWLVPQLVGHGFEVTASARSPGKTKRLRELGAQPIVLDALDQRMVREAVAAARPDAVVYQATALSGLRGLGAFKHFDRSFAQTNRLRTEGLDLLLAAAREYGVGRFVAQSFAGHRYAREGGPVKAEDDRLDPAPVPAMRETVAAMNHLDRAVVGAGGVALRYGVFYGEPDDPLIAAVRARQVPVIGKGGGVWSFVHLHDAAAATVLALERGGRGVYHIVDDDPAPSRVWVPELARILGAGAPRRFPRLLARLVAGQAPVVMTTESRGASNAKARRELGWTPRFPTWREGFREVYTAARQPQEAR